MIPYNVKESNKCYKSNFTAANNQLFFFKKKHTHTKKHETHTTLFLQVTFSKTISGPP